MLGTPRTELVVAVFPLPAVSAGNPYIARLHEALERRGVRFVAPELGLTPRFAANARGRVDVVHLHWLEYIVRVAGTNLESMARTHVRVARYALALRMLRANGIRIVWTVHNRRPHERPFPWLDEPLFRYTARMSDALVLHTPTAARYVATDLQRAIPAWIAPHPHYRGAYPADGRPRAEQRAAYGLDPSSFVYLMFGQVRDYKRIPEAVRAFRELPDRDANLIVAGAPRDDAAVAEIRAAAAGDERVTTLLRHVPDEEVSTLFELADAAVLNQREIFTSGALLLALSYGLPVVAPAEGSAGDVANGPALETFDEGELPRALRAIRSGEAAVRRGAALRAIEGYTHDALAEQVLNAYRGERGAVVRPDHAAAAS
jgi:glycosyltransferase involved in cell wall biosynthesis